MSAKSEGRKIAYGDDPSQFGELSLPAHPAVGVAVVIHGGFWQAAYDLDLGRPLAQDLVARGWSVWNLEYRRVGNGGGAPETFDDVRAGLDKLNDLDLRVQSDSVPVVAIGHSAGGHLATWVAGEEARPTLTAVISQAGVLDLGAAAGEQLGGGAVQALLGREPTGADDAYDPVQQVPLDVPVWCVHAEADANVPFSQSQSYVDAAVAAGAKAELVEVEGDHFTLIDPKSAAWERTIAILDDLVRV